MFSYYGFLPNAHSDCKPGLCYGTTVHIGHNGSEGKKFLILKKLV